MLVVRDSVARLVVLHALRSPRHGIESLPFERTAIAVQALCPPSRTIRLNRTGFRGGIAVRGVGRGPTYLVKIFFADLG